MVGCHFDLFLETVMAMDKTCMIVIGVVGGVALLAILAAIAFCIAFVMFCRKSQAVADSSKTPTDSSKKTPEDDTSKTPASSKTPTDSSKKTPEDDTSKTPASSKTPTDSSKKTPADSSKIPEDDSSTPTDSSKTPEDDSSKTPADGSKKTVAIVDSSKKLIYQDQSTQIPAGSSEEVIKANNVTLAEWQKKVIALTQSIRDFVYRPQRADLSQWMKHSAIFAVFGDIETLQAQNTDLTPPAVSAVLYIWLNSRNDLDDLRPDNIDQYLARDSIQNAVAGLPDDQVRNLIKALADLSDARKSDRQCGAKLYDATTALRSADRTLSGLHFSNNSPYCQIGIAEFDTYMQSVASHLTQARKLITDCMYLYKIPPLSYPVYGGSPGQSLIYNSADSPKKTPDGIETPTNDGSGASTPTDSIPTDYIGPKTPGSPKTPAHTSSPQEVVSEWQKKALSLRQPILDFAYRQYRVFGREVHYTIPITFGDIEALRAQNTALTSRAITIILDIWAPYYDTPNNLTPDNIDEYLARDDIKNAVAGLPGDQVRNLLNGLANISGHYISGHYTNTRQSAINFYKATLSLSDADGLLSGLQFSNNSPSCQIGTAEFDTYMQSVALSLTQAKEFITDSMSLFKFSPSSYSVYGDSPDQSLTYTTPLSADDPQEEVAGHLTEIPASSPDAVIIANNTVLSEWREKVIALAQPIRDCAFRSNRANLQQWLNNDHPGDIYGDLETIRAQNTDLTSPAISTILRHWTQSYGTHSDLTHDNIDDFLALDDVKEAVAELPYNQVRNLLNALVALSDRSAKARQAGFNLYLANFALRSADSILSALHFSNNSPFCQIGIAEFDTYMQSVATHLTQAREFIKHVQTAYNIPSDRYPVYGDTPTQLLTYELRPPSTDSPTTAASSVSGPTPPLVLNS